MLVVVTVTRWTGWQARALREVALRMSIYEFAAHTNLSVSTVREMEAKGQRAQLRTSTQKILDEALARAGEHAQRRFAAAVAEADLGVHSGGGTWTGDAATGAVLPAPAGGSGVPALAVEAAMQTFRCADRRLGGAYLYATVVDFLRSEVAPGVFGSASASVDGEVAGDGSGDGRAWFTAAAALTEMAGWMAHDCGREVDAWRHLDRSRDLVQVGGDRQLHAHVLASMAHMADHAGRAVEADRLACEGLDRLRVGPADPDLEARLLALRARGAAARGESGECARLLKAAERSLGMGREEPRSAWVNQFDEAALAGETARCMLRLGELGETRRQAERVLALRPADWAPRSHAFAKLVLIAVLAGENEWEAVCVLGREVLASTASLGSALVLQQLNALRHRLEQVAGRAGVVEGFLDELRPALRQRWWLQTRLPAAGGGRGRVVR